MEEIYSKKDVMTALNEYIKTLKAWNNGATGDVNAVLNNVITSLEEIATGMKK